MYTRVLVTLDGSKIAEQVLPYARFLAKALKVPVELLEVIDLEALRILANPNQGRYIDTLLNERMATSKTYLQAVAHSFQGTQVTCSVEQGIAEDVVIEHAATDKDTLIVMATHGRSGMQRWVLGSVADKVLHGSTNHLFLIRANDRAKAVVGEAPLKTVIVPLDGSPLAETVLPYVADLARKMRLEVVLMRAYALPPSVTGEDYGFYAADFLDHIEVEARDYLAEKVKEIKGKGLENVSSVVNVGYGAEEIITLAHKTPDNFIAMSTHGRSGIKRWVLGSVTDRVVRHSGDPVLITRAA
jgi:nucleotide-binding universal stress UspA family protein